MQLKESRETKAFFMVDNGIVLPPMDEIPELHIDSEPANEEAKRMLRKAQKPVELELSFDMPVSSGELILVLCGGCTWEQIQQNNWRRLHSIPMRRKGYGSKTRKGI